jgi:hypothetical protein
MMGPLILLSNPSLQCLTFFWPEHPHWWVGYRVSEGAPETGPQIGSPPEDLRADWDVLPKPGGEPLSLAGLSLPRRRWRTTYQEISHQDPAQLSFQAYADGSASCRLQVEPGWQLDFTFRPVPDGVQMSLRLTTQTPIEGAFRVQQCLRFTGAQNWSMRRQTACVPFLSELDVQAMGHPELTLTYVCRDGAWLGFPARHVRFTTPFGGASLDGMLDHGLIVRETLDRQAVPVSYFRHTAPGETWERVAAGLYWQRTAWVSNRHPADCVHAAVDLGPLEAGGSRTVQGKFYWIEGSKDELMAAWRRDFPLG